MAKYKIVNSISGIGYELVVFPDGTKKWYLNGNLHRKNGPAIERIDGIKYWYLNGELHREDGPAAEELDGSKYWYLNGNFHRVDGPAVEYSNGTKKWYLNGELHREDGPAIEFFDGIKQWYLNGKKLNAKWFLDNPNKISIMNAWELIDSVDILKIKRVFGS